MAKLTAQFKRLDEIHSTDYCNWLSVDAVCGRGPPIRRTFQS